jgi:hypothetical protein
MKDSHMKTALVVIAITSVQLESGLAETVLWSEDFASTPAIHGDNEPHFDSEWGSDVWLAPTTNAVEGASVQGGRLRLTAYPWTGSGGGGSLQRYGFVIDESLLVSGTETYTFTMDFAARSHGNARMSVGIFDVDVGPSAGRNVYWPSLAWGVRGTSAGLPSTEGGATATLLAEHYFEAETTGYSTNFTYDGSGHILLLFGSTVSSGNQYQRWVEIDNLGLSSENDPDPGPYQIYSRKKGVGNASTDKPLQKERVEALHGSWYYAWSMDRNFTMAPGIEFAPMRHSKWWPQLTNLANCGSFSNVLTWNEPYKFDGSDPTPEDAVNGGQYQDIVDAATLYGIPGTRVGGPTFQGTNDAWQLEFMPLAGAAGLQIDFVTCHRYPNPNQLANRLRQDCDQLWARYGKPVWVTEFNGADWSATGSWSMVDTYTSLIELLHYFESAPHVERYAIFPWDATWLAGAPSHIFEVDVPAPGVTNMTAVLTPLGKLYANYRTDDIYGPYVGAWYYLHNKGAKQRLFDNAGTPATADIYTEGNAVEFRLIDAGSGHYFIINKGSGERLRLGGVTLHWVASGTDSSVQWSLSDAANGWKYIDHVGTGRRLYTSGSTVATDTASSQTGNPARWSFVRSNSTLGSADTDGDGMDDHSESIAGTDVSDIDSIFQISSIASGPGGTVLSWNSVTGRVYSLDWTDDLTAGFTNIQDNLAFPINSFTDSVERSSGRSFYRLGVRVR